MAESPVDSGKGFIKGALTELGQRATSKLGEYVYQSLTSKAKDNLVFGKPILDLHQLVFGPLEARRLGEDDNAFNKIETKTTTLNILYVSSFTPQGRIWKKIIKGDSECEHLSWMTLSPDAVDTLNEIQLKKESIEQIHKDIPRTFPSIGYFSQHEVQLSIRKILVAISNFIPELGYVQGMNLIVAFLLLHFDSNKEEVVSEETELQDECSAFSDPSRAEFEVFQVFVNLLCGRKFNLLGIFKEGLPNLISFTVVLEKMLQAGDRELFDHLQDIGIRKYIFVYQWILTLFTYSMPFQVVEELWGLFFSQGWVVMFKAFLVLIISKRGQLLQAECDVAFKILRDAPCSDSLDQNFIQQVVRFELRPEHKLLIDDVVLNNVVL